MKKDLLFEIGVEELPSALVKSLAEVLKNNVITECTTANIIHGEITCYATPRRIALYVKDMHTKQQAQLISRRGPSVKGANEVALLGFATSCGVSIEQLTTINTDKGEWWAYEATLPGKDTVTILPNLLSQAIDKLSLPKAMRWGSGEVSFARPVHWVTLLWGSDVIDTTILSVKTDRKTKGHRFHHPDFIELTSPLDYESCLLKAKVVAKFNLRREKISHQIQQIADKEGYVALLDEELLDEVTSIVEWPQALLASFDKKFLNVPAEALIAAMQVHQKCFAMQDTTGKLVPHFITVANIESTNPEKVKLGNEKVMHARLSDAEFFYKNDQQKTLDSHIPALEKVTFQIKLGTLADKSQRMKAILTDIAPFFNLSTLECSRAAALSKCDLLTGMVGEFPELQGIMGAYYAEKEGEPLAICTAIREHYLPRFSADLLPESTLGIALSLADRIDTLVGIFAIGEPPSGVKDPFKLRRHALAIARLLMATPTSLNLNTLIKYAFKAYCNKIQSSELIEKTVHTFILDRLPSFYQTNGISTEIVNAVLASQNDLLFDINQRIYALNEFIRLPHAQDLAAIDKRVNHLLEKNLHPESSIINTALFTIKAEQILYDQICKLEQEFSTDRFKQDPLHRLTQLTQLYNPVNDFFAQVMVMVEDNDLKNNRLSLLKHLQQLLHSVAHLHYC